MPDNSLGGPSMRPPTLDEERERLTPRIKEFRKQVDKLFLAVPLGANDNSGSLKTGNLNLEYQFAYERVKEHLVDAKMWGGKLLEALGSPFPPELADKADAR